MSSGITTYKTEIEALFEEWKQNSNEYFVADGIIDPDLYYKCKVKVLFITKEANDGSDKASYNLCEKILKPENYKTYIRHMIQWTWAINEDFQIKLEDFDQIRSKYIQSFAVVNLKKSGGIETSNNAAILKYAERDKDFINREIEIIDPDVIIGLKCCSILNVIEVSRKRYIEFYHPSYWRFSDQVFLNKLRKLYSK